MKREMYNWNRETAHDIWGFTCCKPIQEAAWPSG